PVRPFKGTAWLAVRPDASQVVTLSGSAARELSVRTWPAGDLLTGPVATCESAAWSRDGTTLAIGKGDGTIQLWRTGTWFKEIAFAGDSLPIRSLAFSPDDQTLAGQCQNGTVKLWNVVTGRELMTLAAHANTPSQIFFSPDGTMLGSAGLSASAGSPSELLLWYAPFGHDEAPPATQQGP
ncbi:MAG TPA: hypothetical protein VL475_08895, partial [Planctomycetaceae bacterium]|nr:hypothetical protein [Planctomycetaceae bacterium]